MGQGDSATARCNALDHADLVNNLVSILVPTNNRGQSMGQGNTATP